MVFHFREFHIRKNLFRGQQQNRRADQELADVTLTLHEHCQFSSIKLQRVSVVIPPRSPSLEGKYSEHGLSHGGERWALAEFVCGTESWRHRDGEGLVRSMVAGSAELSRSLFVARSRDVSGWRGTGAEHGGGEGWALAEFVCGTHRDVIGMERDWCGAWWRGGLSSRGVCLWHGVVTSSGWRETGAEHGGGERWALAEFVCGTDSWRHRDAAFARLLCQRAKGAGKGITFSKVYV